ncbi:hypothetical protein [Actinomadura litoris]|nr:hypothetical protein [Actinomadura litoris]
MAALPLTRLGEQGACGLMLVARSGHENVENVHWYSKALGRGHRGLQ